MLARLTMGRLFLLLALGFSWIGLAACQPGIGDSCGGSRDCSATGARQCDLTQPGGYCTVRGCDPDTCPDSAICVEWRFNPTRTAETWCMRACGSDNNCRTGTGYLCVLPSEITQDGERLGDLCPAIPVDEQLARVIDLESERSLSAVCAAVTQGPPCGSVDEESDSTDP